ncbi:hypothetical protein [Bradyrhizobium sp. 25ACV]
MRALLAKGKVDRGGSERDRFVRIDVLVLLLCMVPLQSASASCLGEAKEFAQDICGEISTKGSSRLVTSSGELNAEAKGLLRRMLGSAGGELKAETQLTGYENVLREQLGSELINVRNCRTRMAEAAIKQTCEKSQKIEQRSSGDSSPNIVTKGDVVIQSK